MLEKQINSLKSTIFIRGSIYFALIVCCLWMLVTLNENYSEALLRIDNARPMIVEMRTKVHDITDSQSLLDEGISQYKIIQDRTEEKRCRDYQTILLQLADLRNKYNLSEPIRSVLGSKVAKINIEHNKGSYITAYDLKIEFNTYDISESLDIFSDIWKILPQYSSVYLLDVIETTVTPKNIVSLKDSSKPFLIRSKLYVKLRDISLNR